jgi:hypothetical protein
MAGRRKLVTDPSEGIGSVRTGQDAPQVDGHHNFWTDHRYLPGVICCLLYAAVALLEFGPLGSLGSGHMTGFGSMDSIEQIWWLTWTAYALPHLHSIAIAQGQNYPVGQNFGVNGSMVALGVVFTPLTRVLGAIVTWNIAVRLAVVASAASMCFVLRRWTTWWPAAFLGGLFYGFSAYTTHHTSYLFLNFVPLPPLILLLLDEILVRQRWRPGRTGILLGAACVLQFFISTEILATTVVVGAIGVVLLALVRRHLLIEQWRYAATAFGTGLGVSCLLLFVPLVITFAGPQHLNGPPFSPTVLAGSPGDLLSLIVPSGEWLNPLAITGPTFTNGALLYLGVPMVVVLAFFAAFFRKQRAILFFGCMALITFVLSLGSQLHVAGQRAGVPLPAIVLEHLPLVDGLVPTRLSLFTALFAAAMFATGVDELWKRMTKSSRSWGLASRSKLAIRVVAVGALVVAVGVPLVPDGWQLSVPTEVPPFFTSAAVRSIPPDSVVLAFPYPDLTSTNPYSILLPTRSIMLDQAVAAMRFKVIGGYGWFPSPTGQFGTTAPTPLKPDSVQALFDGALTLRPTPAQKAVLAKADLTTDLREFLRDHLVQTVLVLHEGESSAIISRSVTAAIGPPVESGGVTVWFHVGQRLKAAT